MRTLHLVDIENLAGTAIPTMREVMDVQVRYARRMALGVDDHVIMASNHLALMNAALGWPHARYRVRSGPDGADLELLDVIESENVAARFSRVVIGSGDGMFGHATRGLMERGVPVTIVSRWGSLAPSLEHAAMDVIYLDSPLRGIAALPDPVYGLVAHPARRARWSFLGSGHTQGVLIPGGPHSRRSSFPGDRKPAMRCTEREVAGGRPSRGHRLDGEAGSGIPVTPVPGTDLGCHGPRQSTPTRAMADHPDLASPAAADRKAM